MYEFVKNFFNWQNDLFYDTPESQKCKKILYDQIPGTCETKYLKGPIFGKRIVSGVFAKEESERTNNYLWTKDGRRMEIYCDMIIKIPNEEGVTIIRPSDEKQFFKKPCHYLGRWRTNYAQTIQVQFQNKLLPSFGCFNMDNDASIENVGVILKDQNFNYDETFIHVRTEKNKNTPIDFDLLLPTKNKNIFIEKEFGSKYCIE